MTVSDQSSDYTNFPDFGASLPRLVVTDMDGTLLNERKELPESFWPVVEALLDRGVHFAPASGRQFATLADQFAPIADRISFIAENGNFVVREGKVVAATVIAVDQVRAIITTVRDYNEKRHAAGRNPLGLIVCGQKSAYFERFPEHFGIDRETGNLVLAEAKNYYHALEELADVADSLSRDKIVKLALFDDEDVEAESAPLLRSVTDQLKAVVSGKHWLDMIVATTNKGTALHDLQESLGITPAETVCFVDYLNDLELIDFADYSFAMANGHPEIKSRAAYLAPSNAEEGVITTLKRIYDL